MPAKRGRIDLLQLSQELDNFEKLLHSHPDAIRMLEQNGRRIPGFSSDPSPLQLVSSLRSIVERHQTQAPPNVGGAFNDQADSDAILTNGKPERMRLVEDPTAMGESLARQSDDSDENDDAVGSTSHQSGDRLEEAASKQLSDFGGVAPITPVEQMDPAQDSPTNATRQDDQPTHQLDQVLRGSSVDQTYKTPRTSRSQRSSTDSGEFDDIAYAALGVQTANSSQAQHEEEVAAGFSNACKISPNPAPCNDMNRLNNSEPYEKNFMAQSQLPSICQFNAILHQHAGREANPLTTPVHPNRQDAAGTLPAKEEPNIGGPEVNDGTWSQTGVDFIDSQLPSSYDFDNMIIDQRHEVQDHCSASDDTVNVLTDGKKNSSIRGEIESLTMMDSQELPSTFALDALVGSNTDSRLLPSALDFDAMLQPSTRPSTWSSEIQSHKSDPVLPERSQPIATRQYASSKPGEDTERRKHQTSSSNGMPLLRTPNETMSSPDERRPAPLVDNLKDKNQLLLLAELQAANV